MQKSSSNTDCLPVIFVSSQFLSINYRYVDIHVYSKENDWQAKTVLTTKYLQGLERKITIYLFILCRHSLKEKN